MNELLTETDLRWLGFHKALASLGDADIAEFSKIYLNFDNFQLKKEVTNYNDPQDKLDCDDCLNSEFGFCDFCDDEEDRQRAEFLGTYCSPASLADYSAWLQGYLKKGGKVTHRYDRFDHRDFYVLKKNAFLPEMYGANSINIIVPENVEVQWAKRGHNDIYFMKNFTAAAFIVPSYNE